jgi:hypothetical protein
MAQNKFRKKDREEKLALTIKITIEEDAFYEFRIVYEGIETRFNCYLDIITEEMGTKLLLLKEVDVEGPGAGYYGTKFFRFMNDAGQELCRMFKTQAVEFHGAVRTTGKYERKIPKPRRINLRQST